MWPFCFNTYFFNLGSLCTGNNDFDRDPLRILKFKEPQISAEEMYIPSDQIEKLEVRYEEYRLFFIKGSHTSIKNQKYEKLLTKTIHVC